VCWKVALHHRALPAISKEVTCLCFDICINQSRLLLEEHQEILVLALYEC